MAIKDSVEISCVTKEAHELEEGDVFIRHDLAGNPRIIKVLLLDTDKSDEETITFVSQEIGSGDIRRDSLFSVAHCHIIASA